MIDIEWKDYDFKRHLAAVKNTRPFLTIAQDIERKRQLHRVLNQAEELLLWSSNVVIVPKDTSLGTGLLQLIPKRFLLGYVFPRAMARRLSTRVVLVKDAYTFSVGGPMCSFNYHAA